MVRIKIASSLSLSTFNDLSPLEGTQRKPSSNLPLPGHPNEAPVLSESLSVSGKTFLDLPSPALSAIHSSLLGSSKMIQILEHYSESSELPNWMMNYLKIAMIRADLLSMYLAQEDAANFRISSKAANSALIPNSFLAFLGRKRSSDNIDIESLMIFLAKNQNIEFLEVRVPPGDPIILFEGDFASVLPSLKNLILSGPITTFCPHGHEKGEEDDTTPRILVPLDCKVIIKPGLEGSHKTSAARKEDVVYNEGNPLPAFPLPYQCQYQEEDLEVRAKNMQSFMDRIEKVWRKQGLRRIDRTPVTNDFLDYCDELFVELLEHAMEANQIGNRSFMLSALCLS